MSEKPVVHGVNASPFVRKVRVALAEKAIDYDQVPQMPMGQPAEYYEISPLGKIPCYVEGDFALPDSSAIIAYLEKKQPEPHLYPQDARAFGRALWYEEYADTKLMDTVAGVFFNRVVKAKMMKQEPDEARVQECLEALPTLFDYLEKEIGDREVLAGSHFSVADIAVGSVFVNLAHAGETVDAARWPKLAAYLERVHARPSFKALIEEEKAAFAAL
ncbi:MAG: glutathione S-transferase family protein [Myxococcota bacterium]